MSTSESDERKDAVWDAFLDRMFGRQSPRHDIDMMPGGSLTSDVPPGITWHQYRPAVGQMPGADCAQCGVDFVGHEDEWPGSAVVTCR